MSNPASRAIKKILDVNEDVAEELGPFIAAPRPSDPIDGAYHDYLRWVCDSYAQVPGWARTATQTAGVQWLSIDATIGNTCRQYLDDGMPTATPPFSGGQCPVGYLVNLSNSGSGPASMQAFANGPISGTIVDGPNQFGGYTWSLVGPSGPIVTFKVTADPGEKWAVASVARVDGQPDNCGNPRPKAPIPSPTRPADPGPSPPGGGQPPVFGPRGTPIFRPGPIKSPYDEPDVPFPPHDPYYPEDGDDDHPYYGPELPKPGDPGDPGAPRDTGEGGDTEGEAPPDAELVGLRIDLRKIPAWAKEYAPGVFRGACYVYMGTAAGLDQDYAGSMIESGQFVFAERAGLTKWRVSANPGYNVRVTPYYREVI